MVPIATGWLIDRFKGAETAAYSILFGIISFQYVIAFLIQHVLAPRFEPLHFPPAAGFEPTVDKES